MTGAYGEKYGVGTETLSYSQEFTPKYKHIQSISIDADTDLINENGAVHWSITDQNGDCVKEGELPYEKLQDSRFSEIIVDVYLKAFHTYYFNVFFDETDGYYPRMVIDFGQESLEESDLDISINYLGNYILRAAGIPLTDRMLYLSDLQKQYPVITKNFIRDAEGTVYTKKEEWPDKILEYESVQYMVMH